MNVQEAQYNIINSTCGGDGVREMVAIAQAIHYKGYRLVDKDFLMRTLSVAQEEDSKGDSETYEICKEIVNEFLQDKPLIEDK